MKKTYLMLATLMVVGGTLKAQTIDPLRDLNNHLRIKFGSLSKPSPVKEYQYDMVGHMTDKTKWTNLNSTTFMGTEEWYRMYQETYFMAFDTLPLQTDEAIFEAMANVASNEIPIGIRDIDYYYFKSDALTTNKYFNFDTINNTITDILPRPSDPFLTKNVFIAAPLYSSTNDGSNTKFLISPSWIFKDIANANFYTSAYTLKIDFGDGTGNHFFDPSISNTYTANYASLGEVNIDVELLQDGVKIKQSKSKLMVLGKKAATPIPTYTTDRPGLTAHVFSDCVVRENAKRKIIIYVPGFDPLYFLPKLKRGMGEIYNGMIKLPQIANLMNFGYEFHILELNNPTQNIVANANYLINYIDFLKSTMPDNKNQFVVIGESMGGLVARYALTFMESSLYTSNLSNPQPERMHNTRLYISLDVPNQGANIPLALQQLYDKASFYGISFGTVFRFFSRVNNLFIDAVAAKQMLIYHIDTKIPIISNYYEHPLRTLFKNDLANIGNYPVHLKKVALTNGLMTGAGQTHFYDNLRRTANDQLAYLNASLYVDFLWFIKIPITDIVYDLRTNPSGFGSVYYSTYNSKSIELNFHWFGVSLQTNNFLNTISENANNVLPYCTSAGSYNVAGVNGQDVLADLITNSTSNNFKWPKGDFWYSGFIELNSGSNGVGCWLGNGRAGFGGFYSLNYDADFCTEGGQFCFIPTLSALDYTDNTLPQPIAPNYNIEANSINHILNHTPFDVVVGIPNNSVNPLDDQNRNHLHVRRAFHQYDCTTNLGNPLLGHFLNREIGDDYLYLDNTDLSYEAEYEAQNYIYVNGFNHAGFLNPNDPNPNGSTININYSFDGINVGIWHSMYSKSNIFVNTSTANFYDNNSTFMYPKDGYYWNNPFLPITDPANSIGTYNHFTNSMATCCVDYSLGKMAKPVKTINKAIKQSMIIFPNPAKPSDQLILNYTFLNTGIGELKIIDINGKTIYSQSLNTVANASSQTSINTSKLNLSAGVYVVLLSTESESNFVKLFIN